MGGGDGWGWEPRWGENGDNWIWTTIKKRDFLGHMSKYKLQRSYELLYLETHTEQTDTLTKGKNSACYGDIIGTYQFLWK